MLKFEAFKKQQRLIERTPQFLVQQLRQRRIVFIRENLTSKENFMIQVAYTLLKKEEQQEVIYLKPDCGDQVLIELTRIAMSDLPENEQLEYHIRAQQLLDYFTQSQVQVQYTSVLYQKINYALALRKYSMNEEVANLLLDCDQILKIKGKQLKKQPSEVQLLARIVQNKLMRLRIIFQCTLLFSESRRNKQALELAKGALKQLRVIFETTVKLCQQMSLSNLINKKQRANSEMSLAHLNQQPTKIQYPQIVETVFKEIVGLIKSSMPQTQFEDKNPILRSHQSRSQSLDKFSESPTPLSQHKLYPNLQDNHPMLQMQILGLMQMTPVDIEELYPISNPEMVVTEEVILELIMLAGLSFYSISTELRFINSNYDNRSNLEIWLCKSLEIYYTYVPHMSSIFNQIYQVYKKLYGVDKQSIPEDQECTHLTKLLRPHQYNNKATLANKVVIVIKIPETAGVQIKHSNTQQKTIPSNKTSKKQDVILNRHLLTQVEDQEDTGRSPSRLFLKPTQPPEVKQRVEFLMNQILSQQAKLSKEKLKVIKSRIKPDLSNGNVGITLSTNSTQNSSQNNTNNSAKSPPKQLSRSLSNSRKTSVVPVQLNIQQALHQTRTAQLKYRYRSQFTEESPTQFSSTRKQNTLDSAKKNYQNKYQLVLQQKLQNLN